MFSFLFIDKSQSSQLFYDNPEQLKQVKWQAKNHRKYILLP